MKTKVKFIDKKAVWNRIVENFGDMADLHVVVGVPQSSADRTGDDDFATMAEVAFFNEFGTEDIPERSFLRSTVDENNPKYTRLYKQLMGKVFDQKTTVKKAFGLLGEKAKADVQRKIRSGVEPANAPATIERKGSSKTLVGGNKKKGYPGGQLLKSITYEVRDGNWRDEKGKTKT